MKSAATVHRLEDSQDRCPNCGVRSSDLTNLSHTDSGCFLGMLVGVIQARTTISITSPEIAAVQDVDRLWERWGAPAADELERSLGANPPAQERSAQSRQPHSREE